MGFRFYKRINLGKGLGINISKSGISSSIRTKAGSIGTKNFSVRTPIKGLSYRGTTGNLGCMSTVLLLITFWVFVIYIFS